MARPDTPDVLLRRARQAYEIGRLKSALARAWPVPVLAAFAARFGASETWVVGLALLLLAAVVGFRWRGQAYAQGVLPGLVAGGAPLVLPSFASRCAQACSVSGCLGGACTTSGMFWCALLCVAGGVTAGALVGFRAARFGEGWSRFLLAGAVVAATTGAMGCLAGGAMGIGGMTAGLVLGAGPTLLLVPRRA